MKPSKNITDVRILHSNIRGYKSKKESLDDIVIKLKPLDVICLNKTGLKGSNKVKLDGFFSLCKNRVDKAMVVVSTSVGKELKPFTGKEMKVKKGMNILLLAWIIACLP